MTQRIDTQGVAELSREVSARMYGTSRPLAVLEEPVGRLRQGGSLRYEDLERLADPAVWPFDRWWRWPTREQIEHLLPRTEDRFAFLESLPAEHGEREAESSVISLLYYDIFKHIELVSIVLRFTNTLDYGMYSPPVAYYLNVPRGYSYGREYRSFLGELRKLRKVYGLKRIADMEQFCWVLAMSQKPELADLREGILNYFHRAIGDGARKRIVSEMMTAEVLGRSDRDRALFYAGLGDYETAGKWAASAFEGRVEEKCREKGIALVVTTPDGAHRQKSLAALVKALCKHTKRDAREYFAVKELRNHIVHYRENLTFTPAAVERIMAALEDMDAW